LRSFIHSFIHIYVNYRHAIIVTMKKLQSLISFDMLYSFPLPRCLLYSYPTLRYFLYPSPAYTALFTLHFYYYAVLLPTLFSYTQYCLIYFLHTLSHLLYDPTTLRCLKQSSAICCNTCFIILFYNIFLYPSVK
jgi:hypothetical protein